MGLLGGRPRSSSPPIGYRAGLWEVIGEVDSDRETKSTRVLCRCACGHVAKVLVRNIMRGGSKGCRTCCGKRQRKVAVVPGWFWAHLRSSAAKRGLAIEISKEYAERLLLAQAHRCAYSGRSIRLENNSHLRSHSTASLDRKTADLGYVEGNVHWVHKVVNLMKNVLTDSEFLGIVGEISQHRAEHCALAAAATAPDELPNLTERRGLGSKEVRKGRSPTAISSPTRVSFSSAETNPAL